MTATILSAATFILIERKVRQPLIPVPALRSRTVWPVLASTFLTMTGIFASTNFTIVMLSQDPHVGYGLNASLSGLLYLTPTAIAGLAAAAVGGWFAQKIGWVLSLRLATGMVMTLSVALAVFGFEKWIVFSLLIGTGVFYLGQFQSTTNGLSVINSPKEAPGSLPGINNACYGLGAGAGIALVAPLVGLGTEVGYQMALWISAALTAGAFVASLLLRPAPNALPTAARILVH